MSFKFNFMFRLRALECAVALLIVVASSHTALCQTRTNVILGTLTNKVVIPVSVFTVPTNSSQGKDPFYPESTRLALSENTTNAAPVIPNIGLTLQGISGTVSHRLAIINGRTLAEGEETEFVSGSSRSKLRCIEIRLDSVVVETDGVRRELRMRNF